MCVYVDRAGALYDVMNYFFQKYCENLISEHQAPHECRAFLLGYANLARRYRKYFHSALSVEGQNSFSSFLQDYGYSYYRSVIESASGKALSEELDIKVKIFTAGTVFITREWIEGKLDISPNLLADIVFESMPPEMAKYLA